MKTYPQQHEPWRHDYPPVWNAIEGRYTFDLERKPSRRIIMNLNIAAFTTARNAIDKAMKQ